MAETDEEREESIRKVQEKLEFLLSRDNLQEDCFIQMNMDSQMQIPIPILAGHEQFGEMGQIADIATLFDAAIRSEQVIVDKETMQIKPILKSKRNTVILHDLPEAIPQEELHDLFERCPAADSLVSIKPDVNHTAFVTFQTDTAATDAALWLRSRQLRGNSIKCSIKSEQFLRSFFPMQPMTGFPTHGVPPWASAMNYQVWGANTAGGWGVPGPPSWMTPSPEEGKGKGKDALEKGHFKGKGVKGAEKGDMFKGGKGKGKGFDTSFDKGFEKGKGKGKVNGKARSMSKGEVEFQAFQGPADMGKAADIEDDNLGYQHDFRQYSRQQIVEICSKMEVVEKPESYKKIESKFPDLALFSDTPNKDWAPLPTPVDSFLGSESRRTGDDSDLDGAPRGRGRKERGTRSRSIDHQAEGTPQAAQSDDWDWNDDWQDSTKGGWWSERWYQGDDWHGRGKMQWVAKTTPAGAATADEQTRDRRKPSWAEKAAKGSGTQRWQAKTKPPEKDEDAAEAKAPSGEAESEVVDQPKAATWADMVRQNSGD